MPGLGAFAIAGAVGGLGDSMVDAANKRREEALLRLRRQWDVEDQKRSQSDALERMGRQNQFSIDAENRQEGRYDATMKRGADALGALDTSSDSNVSYVYSKLSEKGIPAHIAAGLLGNLMQESGARINTGAVGDNGNAFGMAQWNGPRRKAYLEYARQKGVEPTDLDTQIEYMVREFETSESSAWDKIRNATTAEEAALIASKEFWRPGVPHNERRQAYARQVYEAMSDPRQTPQVREALSKKLQGPQPTEYGSEEWVSGEDGTETLMLQRKGSRQFEPAVGLDGEPITRRKDAKPVEMSATGQAAIRRFLKADNNDEEPDPEKEMLFQEQTRKIMREERLSEQDAIQKTFEMAEREMRPTGDPIPGTGFLGMGRDRAEEPSGPYTGGFRNAAPPEQNQGLGISEGPQQAAPEAEQPPEAQTSAPERPDVGLPRIETREQYFQAIREGGLKVGDRYMAPDGSTAYVQPQDMVAARNG